MFRLLFLVAMLIAGFIGGIAYDRHLMRGECRAGEGQWTGTICVGSELLQ